MRFLKRILFIITAFLTGCLTVLCLCLYDADIIHILLLFGITLIFWIILIFFFKPEIAEYLFKTNVLSDIVDFKHSEDKIENIKTTEDFDECYHIAVISRVDNIINNLS